MSKSKIEWTEETWNPVTGCAKVSAGCKHCYAEREWVRLSANPQTVYFQRKFTDVMCHPERLSQPYMWVKPRKIFVNSMSDLFHPDVPFEFIASVFAVMSLTTRHTYQILTKRPERMLEFFQWVKEESFEPEICISRYLPEHLKWQPATAKRGGYDTCGPSFPYENVWLGVSVEDQATANERIPLLLEVPAAVRWLSVEPLLGEIDLDKIHYTKGYGCSPCSACGGDVYINSLYGDSFCDNSCDGPVFNSIDWVVVGGESGHKARPIHPDWVRSIREQCKDADVPFLFKQWGEWTPAYLYDKERGHNGLMDFAKHKRWKYECIGRIPEPMYRVGKKEAGRLLDDVLHDEYPTV